MKKIGLDKNGKLKTGFYYAKGGEIKKAGTKKTVTKTKSVKDSFKDLKLINTVKASTGTIYEEYNYKGMRFKVRYSDHIENLLKADLDLNLDINMYKTDVKAMVFQFAKQKFDSMIILKRGINKKVLGYDEVDRYGGYVALRNFIEKKYHKNNTGIGNKKVIRIEGDYKIAIGVDEVVYEAKDFHRVYRNVMFID